MLDDVTTLTAATRRDARRRTRLAVAVYAICLVALLAAGAYLAPSDGLGVPDAGSGTSVQAR